MGLPLIQFPAGQSQQEGFIAFAGFTRLACVFRVRGTRGQWRVISTAEAYLAIELPGRGSSRTSSQQQIVAAHISSCDPQVGHARYQASGQR
jgi:hypothetical protein